MSGRRDELSGFVRLFMLSGILLVLVATPLPASSAFLHFGVAGPTRRLPSRSFIHWCRRKAWCR
ncbi:hypothetical protein [Paraburkholderia atlantica]|uniref:hypothetical protein n=1 Tax=Paraburkholderia atlantica TaxID=2654982 RepID=UPI0002DBF4A9|nr:hypothetical protein [Paraburkholderia atlantica]MBB5508556.1 hypothetical protein [Paraburkholderia atlantica]